MYVYIHIYMAISRCDLRDSDRFFQIKHAIFQKLFLLKEMILNFRPPIHVVQPPAPPTSGTHKGQP